VDDGEEEVKNFLGGEGGEKQTREDERRRRGMLLEVE
jgi:hypothetical protein